MGYSLLLHIRHCDSGHENGFVYSGGLNYSVTGGIAQLFSREESQSKSWRQYPVGLQKMCLRRYLHLDGILKDLGQ